jgi:ABC-type bacteriocin/lantibiotic exporter with double-glycine peptidase domain
MRLGSNSFIREVLTSNTLSILFDGFFVLTYMLILLVACPSLGLLALGLGALQVIVVIGTRHRVAQLMQRELAARAGEQGYLVEAVSSISLLKASGVEDRALDRWSDLFFNQLNISLERNRLLVAIESALAAIRLLSPMLLLWLGTWSVLDGSMSLGLMLAVNSLASSFLAPIMALVTNGQQLQLVSAHLERIADVLEAEPEQASQEDGATPRLMGRIEVRNLCFQYDPHAPLVLRDISLTIEPGQKVALVGQTGSGKSTLALLLLGLYRPTHGDIFFDGIPLHKFNYRALRGQMGVVLQEPFLFSGSIIENINLGSSPSALEKLIEAARLAGIHDDILQMPMGYETLLSERGTTLSGGQRQRLAIARALAHDPGILVLDEATSHLDVHTESVVDRNLSGLSCTRVVIAHRLSTIRNADQILVLHEGSLVESGTHEELLLKRGYYAALVGSQDESGSEVVTAVGADEASINSQSLIN